MDQEQMRRAWRYSSVGVEFTVVFCAFVIGGIWIDRRCGTLPANTILGVIAGFSLALWRLLRQVKRLREEDINS